MMSNSKLTYAVYIILITCLVFILFLVANDKDNWRGERFDGEVFNFINSSKKIDEPDSESMVSDPSHIMISTSTAITSTKQLDLKEDKKDSEQLILKKNLMFVKTHKCGTSTLVDVFYLWGVRRRLNFVLQPYKHQLNTSKK